MQYTLRNIPAPLDRALRRKARREGRSLNQVAIDGLKRDLALDTNRYRDLCDVRREVVERIERAEAVLLPFVVVAELRAGFAAGSRGRANERHLRRLPQLHLLDG